MFDRFVNFIRALFGALLGKVEDPQLLLNQTYEDLKASLIQVQQAVAQTITVQKQIEMQLKKDQEQVQTWHNRAAMAVQQGKDDLARQALQRKQQYLQSVNERTALLNNQKQAAAALQQRYTELETEVDRARSKKDVLIATAIRLPKQLAKPTNYYLKTVTNSAMSVMDRMEEKVQEREAKSAALAQMQSNNLDNQFRRLEGNSDVEAELAELEEQQVASGGPTKIRNQRTGFVGRKC